MPLPNTPADRDLRLRCVELAAAALPGDPIDTARRIYAFVTDEDAGVERKRLRQILEAAGVI